MTPIQEDIFELGSSILSLIKEFENKHPDVEVVKLPLQRDRMTTLCYGHFVTSTLVPECRIKDY